MHPENSIPGSGGSVFMQVHLRLYLNGDLFETVVINASEEERCSHTELISVRHQVVEDLAGIYDRIFQIWITVPGTDMEFVLHMPIGQSEEWETLALDESHSLGFFRIESPEAVGEHATNNCS